MKFVYNSMNRYNFYKPLNIDGPYIKNWDSSEIIINSNYYYNISTKSFSKQSGTKCHEYFIYTNCLVNSILFIELACLGAVPQKTYLVICLNNQDIAKEYSLGQPVQPAYFNDRCFNVHGVCGVPCADMGTGKILL